MQTIRRSDRQPIPQYRRLCNRYCPTRNLPAATERYTGRKPCDGALRIPGSNRRNAGRNAKRRKRGGTPHTETGRKHDTHPGTPAKCTDIHLIQRQESRSFQQIHHSLKHDVYY